MQESAAKRARNEADDGPASEAWRAVARHLEGGDLASLRAVSRLTRAAAWAAHDPQPPPVGATAHALPVLLARAPHLTHLTLTLEAARAQADVDHVLQAVLGGRALRDVLPHLSRLALLARENAGAVEAVAAPPPALVLGKLLLPDGCRLVLRGLGCPSRLPPGLASITLCSPLLRDVSFTRTDLPRSKTLRSFSLLAARDPASGRPLPTPGVGPALLKAMPVPLHALRLHSVRDLPFGGPFPKALRELEIRGLAIGADSFLAVKGLKGLRRLTVDLSDTECLAPPLVYAFPTFSMAGFSASLEALRLTCTNKRVLLVGLFPPKLKYLQLVGDIVFSPGMSPPPNLAAGGAAGLFAEPGYAFESDFDAEDDTDIL